MKVLVIAPHADDEVLGCGGTLAKLAKEGHEIYRCIVTEAHIPAWSREYIKKKEIEIAEAGRVLGVHETLRLGFPAARLDTVGKHLFNEAISGLVVRINPDIVFIPSNTDLHSDHKIVYEACMVALRPMNSKAIVYSYETPIESSFSKESFIPNVYYDVTDSLKTKLEAMGMYQSELKEFPHPRNLDNIALFARMRGAEVCVEYAEAFVLVREIK